MLNFLNFNRTFWPWFAVSDLRFDFQAPLSLTHLPCWRLLGTMASASFFFIHSIARLKIYFFLCKKEIWLALMICLFSCLVCFSGLISTGYISTVDNRKQWYCMSHGDSAQVALKGHLILAYSAFWNWGLSFQQEETRSVCRFKTINLP